MSALVTAWMAAAAFFSLVAVYRLLRRRPAAKRSRGPALLLRPLDEPAPHELALLRAAGSVRPGVRHVVVSPFRPSLGGEVEWLWSDPLSPNRKVGHLLYALAVLPEATDRVVISADADVRVTPALVDALVAAVEGGAALAVAAPEPDGGGGLGRRVVRALLTGTHQSFRVLDAMAVGARPVCGKAFAVGPEGVHLLRGLGSVVGEDLELSARLHARGARVALVDVGAQVAQPDALPVSSALRRFTRWMQVLRAHRPALSPSVPLLFAPAPALAALCALGVGHAWALAALVAARGLLAALASPGRRLEAAITWPLAEALLLVAFARSWWVSGLEWRGRRFTLGRGGELLPGHAS